MSRIEKFRRLMGVSLLALSACQSVSRSLSAEEISTEEIWKALAERQAAMSSFHVTIMTSHWISGEVIADAARSSGQGGSSKGHSFATPKWSKEFECEFTVKGDLARYSQMIPSYGLGDHGNLVPDTKAFNGSRMQWLTIHSDPQQPPAIGTVRSASSFRQWNYADVMPLTLCFRPLRPELLGEDPTRWRVDSHSVSINGRSCIEVVQSIPTDETPLETRIALDPERSFLPLRYTFGSPGSPISETEWSCETIEGFDVPKSWEHVLRGKMSRQVLSSGKFRRTSFEANSDIASDFFTLIYPPGSRVTDGSSDRKFIVQADGTWKAYGPERKPVSGWQSFFWLWIVVFCLPLAVVALRLRRRFA